MIETRSDVMSRWRPSPYSLSLIALILLMALAAQQASQGVDHGDGPRSIGAFAEALLFNQPG